jgi:hypothetical protein
MTYTEGVSYQLEERFARGGNRQEYREIFAPILLEKYVPNVRFAI